MSLWFTCDCMFCCTRAYDWLVIICFAAPELMIDVWLYVLLQQSLWLIDVRLFVLLHQNLWLMCVCMFCFTRAYDWLVIVCFASPEPELVAGPYSSINQSAHPFCWRDLFDIPVKWRQLSEPLDSVWYGTLPAICKLNFALVTPFWSVHDILIECY